MTWVGEKRGGADSDNLDVWGKEAYRQLEDKLPTSCPALDIMNKYIPEAKTVLDLGCGTCKYMHLFGNREIIGIDQSPLMLKLGRLRGNFQRIASRLEFLPLKDEVASYAYTIAVLQHNRHEYKKYILKEIHRVLKKGGILAFTENTVNIELDDYSFTKEGWIEFVESFGFKFLEYRSGNWYVFRKA